jgi:hypothetical protein
MGKLQTSALHPKQAICGRGWILLLDEAECLPIVERLDAVCGAGLPCDEGASYGAARRGFQSNSPELEAAPGGLFRHWYSRLQNRLRPFRLKKL